MMLVFLRNIREWLHGILEWRLIQLKDVSKKIAIFLSFFAAVLWFSIILYGSFYYTYMPRVSFAKPVFFEFSVCKNGIGMCSFPTSNITLVDDGQDEVFARGQSYSISLILNLPESPVNKDLGMFLVNLQMYDRKGLTIRSVSRSAILAYRSELLRILDTFVFSPLLLFGFQEQRQSLSVEMFSNYIDDVYNPAVGTVVSLHNHKIQLYSAELKIHVNFTGYRYILFHWPILSSVIGISVNFVFLTFVILLSWYQFATSSGSSADVPTINTVPSLEERRRTIRLQQESRNETKTRRELETVGYQGDDSDTSDTNIPTKATSIPECDTQIRRRTTPQH